MKKILFLLIIIILIFAACGCNSNDETPFSTVETTEEESINYRIDKIILSKGFQSIEPSVEVIVKNNDLKLLASLGLLESSGVEIDKITKSGNEINIYINRLMDRDKIQLAVPQVLIKFDDPLIEKLEGLNFNIINKNYETIPLKFGKNQILNKICSQFKVSPNTVPAVNLTKQRDNIFWNISFHNIFDIENAKISLVNLTVKADALTGEILDSKKDTLSTNIDDGYLLDYMPKNYLLYKRQHTEKNIEYESLWTYNMETKERNKLYTSKDKIHSATFSPDNKYISLIEINEKKTDLYMIPCSNKVAYKITPINHLQPRLMKWKDTNTLYFINIGEDRSTLLAYDTNTNQSSVEFSLDIIVDDFDIVDDKFIFIESDKDSLNKNIYLTKDGLDLKKIDTGFKATFLDDNNIIYLNNVEKEDKNILCIYNLEDEHKHKEIDHNIANYFKLNEEYIMFIEKNTCNNDYTLNKYNILEGSTTFIANLL